MPRKAYPFWLTLLALCLTLSACTQPTSTFDNQAATPTRSANFTATVPASSTPVPATPVITDTGLSKGTLKEIFPTLATLPEQIQTIHIRPALSDMVSEYEGNFDLHREGQEFKGFGLVDDHPYFPGDAVLESSKEISLSAQQTRQFIARLIQTPVEEGLYKADPSERATDYDPSLTFQIKTDNGPLLFYSESQKPDFTPWTVKFAGRNFIAQDATPFEAYRQIEPILKPARLSEQIGPVIDINKALATNPAPAPPLHPLKQSQQWQLLDAKGYSAVPHIAFNPVGNFWATLAYSQTVSGSTKYSLNFFENNSAHTLIKSIDNTKIGGPLVFSPDGKYLAGSFKVIDPAVGFKYSPTSVYVREVASGRLIAELAGHDRNVEALAFSVDGHRLVSASSDRTVRVWSLPDGKNLMTLRPSLPDMFGFLAVAISPDGRQIAAAGRGDYLNNNFPVKVWQLDKSGGAPTELTLKGHKAFVTNLAFSADGQKLFSVDHYGNLYQWAINNSGQKGQLVNQQDNLSLITSLSVSQAGKQIATGHMDGTLRLWSATDLKLLSITTISNLDAPRGSTPQAFFSQDGRTIYIGDTATGVFAEWFNN